MLNVIGGKYTCLSYSQDGEDMILKAFFKEKGKYKGFYVDVGAHHPFRFSNTAYFYRKGWQGINIEATPTLMGAFKKFRKRDININAAIGLSKNPLKFFVFNEPALNSFDEKLSEQRNKGEYKIIKTIPVQPVTLSEVLDKHLKTGQKIDFLSVDVEGMDLEVLKSNNWEKYSPDYLLVEDDFFDINNKSEISTYLNSLQYEFIAKTRRTCVYRKNG